MSRAVVVELVSVGKTTHNNKISAGTTLLGPADDSTSSYLIAITCYDKLIYRMKVSQHRYRILMLKVFSNQN